MSRSNLVVRVTTSLVAAPLLLGVLFFASPLGWYGLVAVAVALATMELFGMTHAGDRTAQGIGVSMSLGVSITLYCFSDDVRVLVTLLLSVTACGMLVTLWRLGDLTTAAGRMMAAAASPLYVGALLTTLAMLRRDQGSDGPRWVLLALLLAWLADTGAYFVGRSIGRTPLYPALSPKKTREGLAGAVLGAVGAGLLAHFWFLPSLPLSHALGLGVLAGILGQLGDLIESLLKRSTKVKDSGCIIPGHGGILDRIDALLVVAPMLYLYTLWSTPLD